MIYIDNNLEKQDLFIPRNDGQTCYVSPYDKGYQDGYEDGLNDCGAGCTLQEKEVTVTATTQVVRPDSGYVGMDVVSINASQFVLEKYNEGYHDGEDAGEQTQKDKLASTAFTENGVYRREDGWNEVEVDVDIPELGPDVVSLNRAWNGNTTYYPAAIHKDGFSQFTVYDNGYGMGKYEEGVNAQKALLSSTAFTQNDTYTNQDGWSAVTVNVPTGTSCNLEAKNETITAATQTILPSSGYDGMNSVAVDATSFGNDKYAEGFADGQASCPPCPEPEIESGVTYELQSGFTGVTITPSSGYDGMADVTITDNGYGQEKYDEGYGDGFVSGQTDILSGMSSTAFTVNDTYTNPSGWSAVTVNVPTGSSCNLEGASYSIPNGFTGTTLTPSSGYDGMSAVTITDGGYGQEKYDEGYADGQSSSCNMQSKSVTLTATTECIYPDAGSYEYYLGFNNPDWGINNLIDTGIHPTQTSTLRYKYKGRGCASDRIMGTIDGYQGCTDSTDYRFFDIIGLTLDIGDLRYSTGGWGDTETVDGTDYDITLGNSYVYDNINSTYIFNESTNTVETAYTYTVDVGSVWCKEVIVEDNGVTLFHGTPSEVNGVVGLYDSVSQSFFTLYSGSTGSTVLHAEGQGYDGMSSVCVDASALCQTYYNSGYTDGCNVCYQQGYEQGYEDAYNTAKQPVGLELDGYSWFDTGLYPNSATTAELFVVPTHYYGDGSPLYFLGCENGNGDYSSFYISQESYASLGWSKCGFKFGNCSQNISITNNWNTLEKVAKLDSGSAITVLNFNGDNGSKPSYGYNGFVLEKQSGSTLYNQTTDPVGFSGMDVCNYTIFIGANNNPTLANATPSYRPAKCILVAVKIYDDGVLVGEFLPRLNNGIPCLYDTVTQTYLSNLGSGTVTPIFGEVGLDPRYI